MAAAVAEVGGVGQKESTRTAILCEIISHKEAFIRELIPTNCEVQRRLVPLEAWWECVNAHVTEEAGRALWHSSLSPIISKFTTKVGSELYLRLWSLYTEIQDHLNRLSCEQRSRLDLRRIQQAHKDTSLNFLRLIDRLISLHQRSQLASSLHLVYRHMSLSRETQWDAFSREAELYWVQRGKRREAELVEILRVQEEELQKTQNAFSRLYRNSCYGGKGPKSTPTQLKNGMNLILIITRIQRRKLLQALQRIKNYTHAPSRDPNVHLFAHVLFHWSRRRERQLLKIAWKSWRRSCHQHRRIRHINGMISIHQPLSSDGNAVDFEREHGHFDEQLEGATGADARMSRRVIQVKSNVCNDVSRSLSPLPKTRMRLVQNGRAEAPTIATLPLINPTTLPQISHLSPLVDGWRQEKVAPPILYSPCGAAQTPFAMQPQIRESRSQSPLMHRPHFVFRSAVTPR